MRLVGGTLALDFVNTRTGPPDGPADDDVLTDYAQLLEWSVYAGALAEEEAASLGRLSRRHPDAAAEEFAGCLSTREYLDDLFRALAAGLSPDEETLSRLRDDEADALRHARLDKANGYAWSWQYDQTPARPLRPVVHSAVELLTADTLDRIKCCAGCRFLFLDESKNRSRRWCSMDDCGTAEKVRRYVAARRARTAGSPSS